MNKSSPPMGIISRNWSGEIEASGPPLLHKPSDMTGRDSSNSNFGDDCRTLDWSQPQDSEGTTPLPFVFNPTIRREHPAFIHYSEKGTGR